MKPYRIDEHFFIRVPFGRFVDSVTKADWEGVGVEPDVKVPEADAFCLTDDSKSIS